MLFKGNPTRSKQPLYPSYLFKPLSFIFALILLLLSTSSTRAEALAVSVVLNHCANGGSGQFPTCASSGNTGWITANINASKGDYFEGDFIPYRHVISGLTAGNTYCFGMGWDVSQGGKAAIDYIGTYNATLSQADPTLNTAHAGNAPDDTMAIPADPMLAVATMSGQPFTGVQEAGVITIWGGTMTSVGPNYSNDGSVDLATNTASEQQSTEYCFVANSAQAILAWGGHVARNAEWGNLGRPNGSPYHQSNGTRNGFFTAPRTSETDIVCIEPGGATSHENEGREEVQLSIDAVNIESYDFGDLPDTSVGTSTNNFQTLFNDNGAKHQIRNTLRLGDLVDAEANGFASTLADGDDNNMDDEDGVIFAPGLNATNGGWTEGNVADGKGGSLVITINGGTGYPQVFIDFNQDGDFSENPATGVVLRDNAGNPIALPIAALLRSDTQVYFDVPTAFANNQNLIGVRVRLSSAGGLSATGTASDGEVEDYIFGFSPTALNLSTTNIKTTNTSVIILVTLFATMLMVTVSFVRKQSNPIYKMW